MPSSSSSGSRIIQPGPEDPSLLHMQEQHILQNIWKGGLDRNLKCRRAQQFQNGVDHRLIIALVERWRPETPMFHMPFGECTITLQDVAILLGLPINGIEVVGSTHSDWPTIVLIM
ncbi:unnamed protein product [Lupinus luteus]|uniref:Aminotransferase-like plant mobile domain-containing protein n=1 Tax=Lupinus luteus TaxID=3873 RepID=A0AAV1YQ27_LUPLU